MSGTKIPALRYNTSSSVARNSPAPDLDVADHHGAQRYVVVRVRAQRDATDVALDADALVLNEARARRASGAAREIVPINAKKHDRQLASLGSKGAGLQGTRSASPVGAAFPPVPECLDRAADQQRSGRELMQKAGLARHHDGQVVVADRHARRQTALQSTQE